LPVIAVDLLAQSMRFGEKACKLDRSWVQLRRLLDGQCKSSPFFKELSKVIG
jgi:hypothetical protein